LRTANRLAAAVLASIAAALTGCHARTAAQPFVPSRDPHVVTFRSDRESAWTQFRLGGGLNVVVADPRLPAEPQWRAQTRGGFSSSPTVAGETVLFASNAGKIYAVDGSDGSIAWTASADDQVMTQPVYVHDLVYGGAGNANTRIWGAPFYKLIGDGHNDLFAVRLDNGKPAWLVQLPGSGMPTPALVGESIMQSNGAGVLYAFGAADGSYIWHTTLGSDSEMSQILDGGKGVVYAAGSYPNAVFAVNAHDGAIVWRHAMGLYDGAFSDGPLAGDSDFVYGMYVRQRRPLRFPFRPERPHSEQHVYALEKRTGRARWDRVLPGFRGRIPPYNEAAIPLIYDGLLYDGSGLAPVVSAVRVTDGKVAWQLRVRGPVRGAMAARDGVLYFGDFAGYLWAVDAGSGKEIGKIKTDARFNVGSPIILNDSLLIGSFDGAILAVPLRAIRQSAPIPGVTTAPIDPAQIGLAIFAALLLAGLIALRLGRHVKAVH
jgi:outer membrane protein assembly factor BamB